MAHTSCVRLVAVAASLIWPYLAAAQQPDTTRALHRDTTKTDTTRAQKLAPVVVTGTRLTAVDERTPVQVDQIQVQDVAPGPAAAFQSLLRLPGVSMFDDQGARLQPEIDLRGFIVSPVIGQPQGVGVFVDGVRVNEPDAQEVNFDLVPMDAVTRAELVRGPNTLYGKNSLAGSLLLFTDRGEQPAQFSGEFEGGGFGYYGARVAGGGKVGGLDMYVMGRFSNETGWRDSTQATTRQVFASFGHKGDSSDIAFTVLYGHDKILEAGSLPESWVNFNPKLNYTPGDFFAPDLWHLTLRGDHHLGRGTIRGNVFYRQLDYEQYNGNVPPPNTDGLVNNYSFGGTVEWTMPFKMGSKGGALTVGAEASRNNIAYKFYAVSSPGVPSDSADLADEGCELGTGLCTNIKVNETDAAVYGQGIFELSPSVSLTAAVRYDYVHLPIEDLIDPENNGTTTFNQVSPRLGVNFRISDDVKAYAAFNSGFRAPAPLELSCASADAPCALPFALGADPPLKPVRVYDYEGGVDYDPTPRSNLDVVGFWSDVYDDILFVQPTATLGFFQNVSHTRRAGVEISGAIGLPAGLRVYGSYGYIASTYQTTVQLASALDDAPPAKPGDQFPNSPRNRGTLGLSETHAFKKWLIDGALEAQAYSGQYLRGDEANAQPQIPGYVVANLRFAVTFTHVALRAYITNLFDKTYQNFGVYAENNLGAPPGSAQPSGGGDESPVERFLTPGQPRSFTLALSVFR